LFAPSDVYLRSQIYLEPGPAFKHPVVENKDNQNRLEEFFENSEADNTDTEEQLTKR
jgi:hypothetical protein